MHQKKSAKRFGLIKSIKMEVIITLEELNLNLKIRKLKLQLKINIGQRIEDLSPMSIDIIFRDMDEIELPTGLGMQTLKDQIDKQD